MLPLHRQHGPQGLVVLQPPPLAQSRAGKRATTRQAFEPHQIESGYPQFTLSAACLACGFSCLVNVPLSAARNGGGTFLVVYSALLFLVGYPTSLLLCLLGQYYQVCLLLCRC